MWWATGAGLMLALGSYAAWGVPSVAELTEARVLVGAALVAYVIAVVATRRMAAVDIVPLHPLVGLVTTLVSFSGVALVLLMARAYYSRSFLLSAMAIGAVWLVIGRILKQQLFRPRLAVEPGVIATAALESRNAHWVVLDGPSLEGREADALIADLDTNKPDWQRFHTQCELDGIPVYHAPQVDERLTGRVSLSQLSSGRLAEFRSHPLYAPFKRMLDVGVVLVTAPVSVPVGLLAAIAIKFGSPGPLFFVQERVGQRGKRFRMIKFRSMRTDAETEGARFAARTDERITRIGSFLRQTRIDELPQFWNVLKGEMSVIGPRPEQPDFVTSFEASISFYGYRHLVKPGITGWAQVHFGYAASEEDTRNKLEYDLYYARHCSIWLDLAIIFRTFRTIFTGDGAR
jgi:lipopolysaccharide/colanic/teichoic acid biosynthesis glycosyltransferase